VSESGDQGRTFISRQRMRPPPIKNGWALIVTAVAVVIFIALTLWFTSSTTGQTTARVTDREVIHRLALDLKGDWAQVPGPAHLYVSQAQDSYLRGDQGRALQRIAMSLALDSDNLDAWLQLVILSAATPAARDAISIEQGGAVLLEVGTLRPNHPDLPVAMGWQALREGDPARALSSVGIQPRRLGGRLLRLQALGEDASLADGQAVLAMAPAHGPTCRWTASAALGADQAHTARAVLDACVLAGAGAQTVEMRDEMGEVTPPIKGPTKHENGSRTLDSTHVAR